MIARAIDQLIAAINPRAGLIRAFDRRRLEAVRAYEGASKKDGWRPKRAGASANHDHNADAGELRIRARSLYNNVPYITRGITSRAANVIGTGIMPSSQGPSASQINAKFAKWAKVCDADGRPSFEAFTLAAYVATLVDGEVLLRIRPRRLVDGLPVPMQLQLLECDYIDTGKTDRQVAGQNAVINGIEYGPTGKPVAYWLYDAHPGDASTWRGYTSRRVDAEYIIHIFKAERPGQGRGISALAPVIARTRDLMLYEDAELARKNLEARSSVIQRGEVFDDVAPTGQSTEQNAPRELGSIGSGNIIQLSSGAELTTFEPKPAGGYVDYVKNQLRLIAAGLNVTYEMLTSDVSEGNFSSVRANTVEFRRFAEQEQWLFVVPSIIEPIFQAFLKYGDIAGLWDATKNTAIECATPKWDYVNPAQDVEADLREISGGLSSISEKLRRRGYKPEAVFEELKNDLDTLRKSGVLDVLLQLQTSRASPKAERSAAE